MSTIRILKFGSSVLARRSDLAALVHEIYAEVRAGHRVVAVVSARRGATDRLDARARSIAPDSASFARAALLATGERAAAAELALAVERAGVPVELCDPATIGLRASGPPLDAEPCDLDVTALLATLERAPVAIVPGFFGVDGANRPVLFGRGGSDLTALFLAARLPNAAAKLVKDVDGVYERDPAASDGAVARYRTLTHADALGCAGRLVQEKALRFAAEHGLDFEVGAIGVGGSTRIGRLETGHASRLARAATPRRPLRVVLLGAGTVGGGVYRHLARRPELFDVQRVLVRRGGERPGLPARLVARDLPSNALEGVDVVVELIGGVDPAHGIVRRALERGVHVVTANKELLAAHGTELDALAASTGAQLLASAAVGGAVPMLETAARCAGGVRRLRGVLNGTTNWVLSRVEAGDSFDTAVAGARRLGFCEADPWADLSGEDALRKLELLARAAFGAEIPFVRAGRRGIDELDACVVRSALARGRRVKLVAEAERAGDTVFGRVAPIELAQGDALSTADGAGNRLTLELDDGSRVDVHGTGAGRWPTAESVLGDLLSIARDRRAAVPCALTTIGGS